MSGKNIDEMVESTLDLRHPEPSTNEELRQLDSLGEMEDNEIDYSDASRTPAGAGWTRPGKYGGPVGKLRARIKT